MSRDTCELCPELTDHSLRQPVHARAHSTASVHAGMAVTWAFVRLSPDLTVHVYRA